MEWILQIRLLSLIIHPQSASQFITMELELGIAIWSRKKFSIQKFLQIKLNVFTCCVIDPDDKFAYLGTKTGDIMEISLNAIYIKELVLLKSCSLKVLWA